MEVILGVLLGWAIAASVIAGFRLIRPPRVISNEQRAMQEALHAATATLPHLRRGLSADSAAKTVGHLLTLTQARAVALLDAEGLLAFAGDGSDHHDPSEWVALAAAHGGRDDRLHVENRIRCSDASCPIGSAVLAPLVVREERVGTFLALFSRGWRLTPDETRTVGDAASLVSAELALAEFEAQSERLARAELHALRAQISPHFVYNALAAIAGYIHSNPEEARELLTEFAEFTRYAFRGRSPYVTLADELSYVEKYLRLERARFGDRLEVRLQVAPEVLPAVVPMLSLQPLVENAVRHGVERRGRGRVEIVGRDIDADVELRVTDDGVGMDGARATEILAGEGNGVGLMNVQARLQAGVRSHLWPGDRVRAGARHHGDDDAAQVPGRGAGGVSAADGGRTPPPLRSPRQELADSTAHGDVYLRRLRHAQLQLSLLALVAFGAVFGVLPLALYLLPGLDRIHLLGVPLPIWILLVPLWPLFIAIGWLYAHRADAGRGLPGSGGQVIALLAIGTVTLGTLGLGAWGVRFVRTTSDLLVASRTVTAWWNAAAISGEYLSAASFLGIAGLEMKVGASALWQSLGFTAGYLALLLFVAAPLRRFGSYTIPDFVEARAQPARASSGFGDRAAHRRLLPAASAQGRRVGPGRRHRRPVLGRGRAGGGDRRRQCRHRGHARHHLRPGLPVLGQGVRHLGAGVPAPHPLRRPARPRRCSATSSRGRRTRCG